MKSAYGRVVPPPDRDLTSVAPGSPMGELMRRYWQPVALSADVRDLPKAVRILCEDLVVFRTKAGAVGCLEKHCSHRGTSLEWGRVEEHGIRCCYHGWLYAPDGRVTEMPCESAEFCASMAIDHPAYPTHEFGGLIFVYMGPPETVPLFPMYDIFDDRGRTDFVARGMQIWEDYSIGYVRDCNWLQHYENVVDPWHLLMLHQMISGDQFQGALMQGWPSIGFERTPIGVRYQMIKDLPNGNRLVRYVENVVPNVFLVSNIHEPGTVPKRKDKCSEFSWCVPVDDEHLTAFSLVAWPLENGAPKQGWRPRTDTILPVRPAATRERPYEERQRRPDDLEAQEGQRTIAVHALENLGHSDMGIVLLRRMLREQAALVANGQDPVNVVRDPALNHRLPTHAWNTILSPEERLLHTGEEV